MHLFVRSIFLFCMFFGFSQVLVAEESEHEIFEAIRQYFQVRIKLSPPSAIPSAFARANTEREDKLKDIEKIILQDRDAISARNEYGRTPLHEAAIHTKFFGFSSLLHLLLHHGADVHARDNLGMTVLHVAIGDMVVKVLLSHGADVNVGNNKGETPLYRQIKSSIDASTVEVDVDVIVALIKNGGKVDTKLSGQKADVLYILSFGDQVSKGNLEIYHTRSAEEIVEMLQQIRQLVKNEVPNELSKDVLKSLDARIAEEKRKGSGGSGGTCSKGFE